MVGGGLPRDLWGVSGKESGATTLENDADVTKDITKHSPGMRGGRMKRFAFMGGDSSLNE